MTNPAYNDKLAKHLGAEIIEVKDAYAKVKLKITENFLNGVDLAHGGVMFSLADFAFALAANTTGETGLAIQANINYIKPGKLDDELFAEVKEDSRSRRLGNYSGKIYNQHQEILAHFSSIAYYKNPKK